MGHLSLSGMTFQLPQTGKLSKRRDCQERPSETWSFKKTCLTGPADICEDPYLSEPSHQMEVLKADNPSFKAWGGQGPDLHKHELVPAL